MDNPSTPPRAPTSLFWLAGVIAAFGLAAGVCTALPSHWLHQLGDRLGHTDDVTPERITRLRLIGVGLVIAHGLLASSLLTWGRAGAERFIADLGREIASANPLAVMRRGKEWAIQSGWFHVAALLVVLATAVGIRLKYLDVPMDYDEAYSFLNYARRPLYEGLADYNSTNNHLLNTLFMHISYRLFGPQEWALRLHVFVAGVALVGTTYGLGWRLHGREVGLMAAALVATSYVMINYSVNARGYIWTAWMTALLVDAFGRIATTEPQPRALQWLGAGLVAVLGVVAIPTMAYSILGCIIWLSIRNLRSGRPAYSRFVGLELWTLLVGLASLWLYAPALVLRGVSAWQHPFVAPQHIGNWFSRVPAAWSYALKSGTEGPVPWLVPAAFFLVGLVVLWWMRRDAFWLIVAVPLATFAVMALQRVTPPPRIFSFLTPLIALVAAAGLFATCQLIYLPRYSEAPDKTHRHVNIVCSFIATGLCYWTYYDYRGNSLPGGLRPAYLVEDVAEFWRATTKNANELPDNQLWRLGVLDAVILLEPELRPNDRVLVGLPMDLPFHFYATRRGWTTPVGGQPSPGERLFLMIRAGEDPRTAVRDNLSLRFTEPWIHQAQWQPLATSDSTIWLAHPVEAGAKGSDSN